MNKPLFYQYQNSMVSQINPNKMRIRGNPSFGFFRWVLMQDIVAQFKWTLPKTWNKYYFLYGLYEWGRMAVINTDRFGVIPQGCGLMGFNVQYGPVKATISNPLLKGILTPVIDKQCTIIRLMPDWSGVLPIVDHYAEMMTAAWESLVTNLLVIKFAYVFACKNKSAAESFKKMFDSISSGDPAVFVDSNLINAEGSPSWELFEQNIKNTLVAPELLETLRGIKRDFDTMVGIPSSNTDKRERLVSAEATSNQIETYIKVELWYDQIQDDLKKTREMFGLSEAELSMEWRHKPQIVGGEQVVTSVSDGNGPVQDGPDTV